jgi:hypothetical protein
MMNGRIPFSTNRSVKRALALVHFFGRSLLSNLEVLEQGRFFRRRHCNTCDPLARCQGLNGNGDGRVRYLDNDQTSTMDARERG